jgi:hypothetical protein
MSFARPRRKGETMTKYQVHPIAEIFPLLTGQDFEKFKLDIKQQGQREPAVLNADGVLLDGRNRERACNDLGIELQTRTRRENEGTSDADFIWSVNVHRRHLTGDQRSALVMKFEDAKKAESHERSRQNLKQNSDVAKTPPRGKTRERLAKEAKVSPHKIRQAATVKKHAPELLEKVERGEMPLREAEQQVFVKVQTPKRQTVTHVSPVMKEPAAPALAKCISPREAAENVSNDAKDSIEHWRTLIDPAECEPFHTLVGDLLELLAKQFRKPFYRTAAEAEQAALDSAEAEATALLNRSLSGLSRRK